MKALLTAAAIILASTFASAQLINGLTPEQIERANGNVIDTRFGIKFDYDKYDTDGKVAVHYDRENRVAIYKFGNVYLVKRGSSAALITTRDGMMTLLEYYTMDHMGEYKYGGFYIMKHTILHLNKAAIELMQAGGNAQTEYDWRAKYCLMTKLQGMRDRALEAEEGDIE